MKKAHDTEFNKHVKVNGGWLASQARFAIDGKLFIAEDYSNIKTGMTLNSDLWNQNTWATVDQNYWQ